MKILVCNVGSTSLKYQVFEMPGERQLAHGGMERIGSQTAHFRHRAASKPEVSDAEPLPDQRAAIQRMISLLCDARVGALADLRELNGIGFKVVGGRGVTGATLLDDQVLAAMEEYVPLLPAHNPPYIAAVRLFRDLLPGVPLVGLFETAFHEGMPPARISIRFRTSGTSATVSAVLATMAHPFVTSRGECRSSWAGRRIPSAWWHVIWEGARRSAPSRADGP